MRDVAESRAAEAASRRGCEPLRAKRAAEAESRKAVRAVES